MEETYMVVTNRLGGINLLPQQLYGNKKISRLIDKENVNQVTPLNENLTFLKKKN